MDKFQQIVMVQILTDKSSILTSEQMETFSGFVMSLVAPTDQLPDTYDKLLYHKIATSLLERGPEAKNFMNYMKDMKW